MVSHIVRDTQLQGRVHTQQPGSMHSAQSLFEQCITVEVQFHQQAGNGVLIQLQAEKDPRIYSLLLSPHMPQGTFCYVPISLFAYRYRHRYQISSGEFSPWSAYCMPDRHLVLQVGSAEV